MKSFMNYDFGIEKIILACYVAPGKGTAVHTNRPSHGLAFHPEGDRYYVFSDGKTVHAVPNDIVYLPKGSSYVVKSEKAGCCYAINFELSEEISFSPFGFKAKNPSAFLDLFKEAEKAWRTKSSCYNMKCKADLYSIICGLIREYELGYISKKDSDLLLPAIEFIHNEYTKDNISIPYLSELCGISETYFRKLFEKKYGISPLKYINNLKIVRAKELISSGIYTIAEVAELSGYHDESYFSREFKKITKKSPSEYN